MAADVTDLLLVSTLDHHVTAACFSLIHRGVGQPINFATSVEPAGLKLPRS
jgi:hypothetical protein